MFFNFGILLVCVDKKYDDKCMVVEAVCFLVVTDNEFCDRVVLLERCE